MELRYLTQGSFSYVPSQVYSEIILKNAKSSEVFLGVRPEDIQISVTKAPNSLFLSEVYVVEHQGANMVVDLKIDSEIIKAITQPMPLSIGQRVWVGFDEEKTHVYDGGTEQLIV